MFSKFGDSLQTPRLLFGAKFLTVLLAFFWICFNRLDPDFGWHLQAGNYFRQNGLPKNDVFSYTASNFPWINHEWANDLLVSFVYGLADYLGLAIIFATLWTLALFIAAPRARLITLLVGVSALAPYVGVRALAWSALFLSVLLWLCNHKQKRILYLIPLLIFIWANFHGGFVVGLAVLAYFWVLKRKLVWFYLLWVSVLASFINFYGLEIYAEVWRTVTDREVHGQITEWARASIYSSSIVFVSLWATGFWLFEKGRLQKWYSLPVLFFVASLATTRHFTLFVIVSIKNLDNYISRFLNESLKQGRSPHSKQTKKALVLILSLNLVITLIAVNWSLFSVNQNREKNFPAQAVEYIKTNPCNGNIFNSYDFGGYLIWKLPGQKVYIDGRMPIWRDENGQKYFSTYFEVLQSPQKRYEQFTKYDIKCVLIGPDDSEIRQQLLDSGWIRAEAVMDSTLLLAP